MAHLATARRRSPPRTVDRGLTAAPAPTRAAKPRPDWWLTGALVATAVVAWELLARAGVIPVLYFPAPTTIADSLGELAASGDLARNVRVSLQRLLPGLLLGGLPGLTLGLAMGWSPRLRAVLDPIVAAVHPVPKIAVLPLVMVIFGIGEASKIFLVALAVFFPMLINSMAGVRQISPLHFEVAENYGAGRWQVLTRVVLPGSLPLTLSGLRLALNLGLLITIATEIMTSTVGLGAMIWLAWEILRVDLIYVALLLISLIGIGFNLFVQFLLRRLVPWQVERASSS